MADFRNVVLLSKDDAELVLKHLSQILDRYDAARLADLYDLVGLPTTYLDNNSGWKKLENVQVSQVENGWVIQLPDPEEL